MRHTQWLAYRLIAKLLRQSAVIGRELVELNNALIGELDGVGILLPGGLTDRGIVGGGRHGCIKRKGVIHLHLKYRTILLRCDDRSMRDS